MPVVVCSNCGSKNRVNPQNAAGHIAKCGKCGHPLDLPANAEAVDQKRPLQNKPLIVSDETFERDVRGTTVWCSWIVGLHGADRAGW